MIQRAAIYTRVSTSHQAEERTIDSQVQALTDYVQQHGLQLEARHIYRDEGQSGSQLDRPALDRLRDDAYAGLLDIVLVYSPDRLARRYAYQVLLVEEFQKWGCAVFFLERPLQDNPEDRLLLEIQGAFAEYERAKLMERCRRGKLHKARTGQIMNVRAPYGYRYIHKRDGVPPQIVVDAAQAEVVRQVFQWYVEGKSVSWIAKQLTERRIPTKFARERWARISLHHLLANPAYVGTLYFNRTGYVSPDNSRWHDSRSPARPRRARPKEEWIPVTIPAIVEEAIFERAQQLRQKNLELAKRNNRRHQYLLRGLVCCKSCRQMKGRRYYRCMSKLSKARPCASRMVRADQLERASWEAVKQLLKEPQVVKQAFTQLQSAQHKGPVQARIERLEQALAKSTEQIQRLIDAYASGIIELKELRERRESVEARMDNLRQEVAQWKEQERHRLEEQEVVQSLTAFRRTLKQGFKHLGFADRQQLLRLLVEEIEVSGREVQIKHIVPILSRIELRTRSHNFRTA